MVTYVNKFIFTIHRVIKFTASNIKFLFWGKDIVELLSRTVHALNKQRELTEFGDYCIMYLSICNVQYQ